MPGKFYSVSEAAKLLGVSRQGVHLAIKRGILKATKGKVEVVRMVKSVQRGLRISEKELHKYRPDSMHQWLGKQNY